MCYFVGCQDGKIAIYDTNKVETLNDLYGHQGPVTCMVVSNKSKRLFSGSKDKTLRVWDITDENKGVMLSIVHTFEHPVTCVAFIESSGLLYVGIEDMTVHIFDISSLLLH